METVRSVPPAGMLSRAEGFLAGLIYLDSMRKSIGRFVLPDHASPNSQSPNLWQSLEPIYTQLEDTRQRLVDVTRTIGFVGLDSTLDSFSVSTQFYETAVGGFRGTILGLPPTALGDVVALCSLSHAVASYYIHNRRNPIGFVGLSSFTLWGNAIGNHHHRHVFGDLIKGACLEPRLSGPIPSSPPASLRVSHPLQPNYDDLPIVHAPYDDVLGSIWDPDHYGFFPPFSLPFKIQTGESSYATSEIIHAQAPDLQSLQGSPVITNLTRFLRERGEFMIMLSNRGATVKQTESRVEHRTKPLRTSLRDDESLKDPATRGILSIVDRFLDLGYLQSEEEVQNYMFQIGKDILPNGRTFFNYCRYICANMMKDKSRKRMRPAKPKEVPCNICGRKFTRNGNMKRHRTKRHPDPGVCSTPVVPVSLGQTVLQEDYYTMSM